MKSDNVKNVRIRFKRDTEVIVVTAYELIDEEPDNLKDLIDRKTFLEVYLEGNNAMPIPNP